VVGEGEAEDDGVDGDLEDALLPKEMPIIAPTFIRGKTIATEVNCGQISIFDIQGLLDQQTSDCPRWEAFKCPHRIQRDEPDDGVPIETCYEFERIGESGELICSLR
jgi:hypothetical protein